MKGLITMIPDPTAPDCAKLTELVKRTDRIAERCGISFEEALALLLAQALKIKTERNKAELHTDD